MGKIVDIHSHFYPPSYILLLQSRTSVPYIRSFPDAPEQLRLIILPGENDNSSSSTSRGRPVGPEYWDVEKKIAFMNAHGIDKSVLSLANPWLDFMDPSKAAQAARMVNDDLNELGNKYPARLYAFGTLPLSAGVEAVVQEIKRLAAMENMRGVIIGTSGLGKGLDDPDLEPVYAALQKFDQLMFLHPHYGLPSSAYGPKAGDYGHVLPLALGFPLETTIAVTRMYISRVWDDFKKLKVLLAHSGGTLPFLAGRIESCIEHDSYLNSESSTPIERSIGEVLMHNIYLDAVIYSEVGLKAALEVTGVEGVMFGKIPQILR